MRRRSYALQRHYSHNDPAASLIERRRVARGMILAAIDHAHRRVREMSRRGNDVACDLLPALRREVVRVTRQAGRDVDDIVSAELVWKRLARWMNRLPKCARSRREGLQIVTRLLPGFVELDGDGGVVVRLSWATLDPADSRIVELLANAVAGHGITDNLAPDSAEISIAADGKTDSLDDSSVESPKKNAPARAFGGDDVSSVGWLRRCSTDALGRHRQWAERDALLLRRRGGAVVGSAWDAAAQLVDLDARASSPIIPAHVKRGDVIQAMARALERLVAEGLVVRDGDRWSVPAYATLDAEREATDRDVADALACIEEGTTPSTREAIDARQRGAHRRRHAGHFAATGPQPVTSIPGAHLPGRARAEHLVATHELVAHASELGVPVGSQRQVDDLDAALREHTDVVRGLPWAKGGELWHQAIEDTWAPHVRSSLAAYVAAFLRNDLHDWRTRRETPTCDRVDAAPPAAPRNLEFPSGRAVLSASDLPSIPMHALLNRLRNSITTTTENRHEAHPAR